MISKKTICFLICLAIFYGLCTLSYNLVLIENQDGIFKVFATSDEDSGDSPENSAESSNDSNPDDSSSSTSEGASDNSVIGCDEDEELIDGECRKAQSAGDIAASGGNAGAASASGDLAGAQGLNPSDLMASGEMATADMEMPQNEPSQPNNDRFYHNSEDIALELSSLTPLQIAEYPITELSDNDLVLALSFLVPADLGKVLKNIPATDLTVIKERLGESRFNEFLSKVSISDREFLENALAT